MHRSVGGFTLIEVLVSMALGAMVVLVAHETTVAVWETGASMHAERLRQEQRTRARALLEPKIGNVVMTDRDRFDGDSDGVVFYSQSPGRDTVRIAVRAEGGWLHAVCGDSDVALMPAASVSVDYLPQYGADQEWAKGWHSPASLPVGVRLRIDLDSSRTDTLLLVIGERG